VFLECGALTPLLRRGTNPQKATSARKANNGVILELSHNGPVGVAARSRKVRALWVSLQGGVKPPHFKNR
jgi:hypothetical protein